MNPRIAAVIGIFISILITSFVIGILFVINTKPEKMSYYSTPESRAELASRVGVVIHQHRINANSINDIFIVIDKDKKIRIVEVNGNGMIYRIDDVTDYLAVTISSMKKVKRKRRTKRTK